MAESSSGAAHSRRRPKMYYPGMHHGRLHQKLIAFAAASAIVWSAWPLAADTYPRQPGIDARHYAVRLTLLTERLERDSGRGRRHPARRRCGNP